MDPPHPTDNVQQPILSPDFIINHTPNGNYGNDPANLVNNNSNTNQNLPDRLTRLAQLASQNRNLHLKLESHSQNWTTLHQCLDTLESILDLRPHLTQEIVRCRPAKLTTSAPSTLRSTAPPPAQSTAGAVDSTSPSSPEQPLPSQLEVFHSDVQMLRVELEKRREESLHIYDLFSQQCQTLTGRIAELECEIGELRADLQQDAAEREALQGTVRGLETWIKGWQVRYVLARMERQTGLSRQQGRGWWSTSKKKTEQPWSGFDAEALFDGIMAWMRGWRDVEEEFRNREKVRRLRKDKRETHAD